MKIKILHTLPDLHIGGVANLLIKLLNNFSDEKYDHHLCYFGDNEILLSKFKAANITVHKITHKGLFYLPLTCFNFFKLLKRNNIHIVHAHLFLDRLVVGLTTFFLKIKVIISIHTTNIPKENKSLKRRMMNYFEDVIAKLTTDKFVCVSDTVKSVSVKYRFVDPKKALTIYSGVKLPHRRKKAITDDIRLVSVGRLIPSKGFEDLIDVIALIKEREPRIKLSIFGDGPLKRKLKILIKKKNLCSTIRMAGHSLNVEKHLNSSHIYLTCSYEEGFGLSVVEALAYSLPVVSYNIPIFKEISENGNSFILTNKSDLKKYAQNVLELISDSSLYQNMSEKSYSLACRKFNIKSCADQYLKLYESIVLK